MIKVLLPIALEAACISWTAFNSAKDCAQGRRRKMNSVIQTALEHERNGKNLLEKVCNMFFSLLD